MTDHYLLNLKLLLNLKNNVSVVGLDKSPDPARYTPTGWDIVIYIFVLKDFEWMSIKFRISPDFKKSIVLSFNMTNFKMTAKAL